MSKTEVQALITQAANAGDSADAMRFSQAACNAANALSAIQHIPSPDIAITEDQIRHMVERFLGWRLPENFQPDGGIVFTPRYNNGTKEGGWHEPSGTNLLDYAQARDMVRHMIEGI